MSELELLTFPETGEEVSSEKIACPSLAAEVDSISTLIELAILAPTRCDCADSRELVELLAEVFLEIDGGEAVLNVACIDPKKSFLFGSREESETDETSVDNDIAYWLGEDYCQFLKTQKFEDGRIIIDREQLKAFCSDIVTKHENANGDLEGFRGSLVRW